MNNKEKGTVFNVLRRIERERWILSKSGQEVMTELIKIFTKKGFGARSQFLAVTTLTIFLHG